MCIPNLLSEGGNAVTYICIHTVHIYSLAYIYSYIYMYVYACKFIGIYIYIYINTHVSEYLSLAFFVPVKSLILKVTLEITC